MQNVEHKESVIQELDYAHAILDFLGMTVQLWLVLGFQYPVQIQLKESV